MSKIFLELFKKFPKRLRKIEKKIEKNFHKFQKLSDFFLEGYLPDHSLSHESRRILYPKLEHNCIIN